MIAALQRHPSMSNDRQVSRCLRVLCRACRRWAPIGEIAMQYEPIAVGSKIGRWSVLEELSKDSHHRRRFRCQCECGLIKVIRADGLHRPGNIGCCACAKRTHALIDTPEYSSWASMKSRCSNPNDDHWPRYGGVGVTVCQRWIESFEAFLEDMGQRPDNTTLDRYPDPFGNYEPNNCRWATPSEQQNNRRDSVRITVNGVTKTPTEWSRITGVSAAAIASRFYYQKDNGFTNEECVSLPLMKPVANSRCRRKSQCVLFTK